jgi:hypothetical protein
MNPGKEAQLDVVHLAAQIDDDVLARDCVRVGTLSPGRLLRARRVLLLLSLNLGVLFILYTLAGKILFLSRFLLLGLHAGIANVPLAGLNVVLQEVFHRDDQEGLRV